VSQLKPCFNDSDPSLELPSETVGNLPQIEPLAVIDWETINGVPTRVLIQWTGLFPEDATWENYEEIKNAYPGFNLEDKVGFDEPRDVMSGVQEQNEEVNTPQPIRKSTRSIVKPKAYEDFVCQPVTKGSKKKH
jgi:hypothetical protein